MVREILNPLVQGQFWMKFLGVMLILSGVLQALTIIGLLWAWVPVWLGVLLFQASKAAEAACLEEDVAGAVRATDKLRLFFMVQGILILLMLLAVAAMMALGGVAMLLENQQY